MELKTCGRCRDDKPLTLFYRAGRAGYCIPCEKAYKREHYAANAESIKAKSRAWAEANPERKAQSDKAYRSANAERCAAKSEQWAKANPQRRKAIYTASRAANIDAYRAREAEYRASRREACNARIKDWKRRNPHKLTHYFHKRRAAELQAMPAWADLDAMEAVYAEAQRRQAETGVPHHVDHIVPILSKIVCGLHCEANLRAIPAAENVSKQNRYWPDMP